MKATISVRLRKNILSDLDKIENAWQADRSETIRRLLVRSIQEWKVRNALKKLAQHKISLGKAAEECGISLWEMLEIANGRNIDWTGYNKGDLEKDLKHVK